jgi:hypothetical protein
VASAGIGAVSRPKRSVGAQIARGIGLTVALLVGSWVAFYVCIVLFFFHDNNGFDSSAFSGSAFHANWAAILPTVALAVASWIAFRRMRAWDDRPRLLIPATVLVVATTSLIAYWPYSVATLTAPSTRVAVADAWHPVVAEPSEADLVVWQSHNELMPFPKAPTTDPVGRRAFYQDIRRRFLARRARIEATPAFQRADRYIWWTYGQGPCTATSRNLLAASGGVLLLGGAALGMAVKRRRRAYLRRAPE